MLSPLGECPEVAEEKIEAYAVLAAMGPTYLWFQLQALREVTAGLGLSDAEITPALKIIIVAALTVAVIGAVALKKGNASVESYAANATAAAGRDSSKSAPVMGAPLPKLLDLGANKCIPCKAMAPILEDLKKEYAGKMNVEFIDVWKNPGAGKAFGIGMIPTQIFFDASGTERFRHVGFFGQEDLLGKWKELGVDLSGKTSAGIIQEEPAKPDTRPRDQVYCICDEDIQPKTKTVVKSVCGVLVILGRVWLIYSAP